MKHPTHIECEILHLLREWREEQKRQHEENMIAQATFDASLAALTAAINNAAAALAAGSTSTSTPDSVVNTFLAGVASQVLVLATATPPPGGGGSTLAITTQPVGAAVAVGAPFTLTVVATGATPTYQWSLNGLPVASPSAATATLSVAAAALTDAGSYTVTVTDPSGQVTSNAAVITVA
jgi:hypothetical protein